MAGQAVRVLPFRDPAVQDQGGFHPIGSLGLKPAPCPPMRSTSGVNRMGQWRQANTGVQRFPRIVTAVPVRISTVDPETDPDTGSHFFRSAEETTANLSRGGAYLRSWEPLEPGRQVIVAIDLPSGQELQLTARVAWTRRELRTRPNAELEEPGYAVEFVGGSNRELAELDRFMDSVEPARKESQAAPDQTTPNPTA